MNYYPAFLNLEGEKAVVIGGGKVAERKVLALIRAGAKVTVVSPALTKKLRKEKEAKRMRHIARSYRQGDLRGSFLVIAATDSPSVNTKVAEDAPALINVVDVPSECNFIVPSVVRRGPLVIAISTGGSSPAVAKAIRKETEKLYGTAFTGYLGFVRTVRARAMREVPDRQKRERFLKGLASGDMLDALRTEGLEAVKQSVQNRYLKLKGARQAASRST